MPPLRPYCLVPFLALEDCLSSQAGQSGIHNRFRPRDLGAGGNTVFGVIIAVGFASLILICGVTSRAYRRVARQEQYLVITDDQQNATGMEDCRESPMLWDLLVDEDAKERVSEWDDEVPVSAKLELNQSVDSVSISYNEKRSHRRRGKIRPPIELASISESSGEVDVAILIAMPSPRTSALTADSRSDIKVRFDDDEELWSGYAIGTTRIGYVGD
ncbi:hypothetical protein BC629DRAFT_259735 [Irpex lacteus]|nr:hypothetical protein BC629DRAFT_259735 [Irpex lacteus]